LLKDHRGKVEALHQRMERAALSTARQKKAHHDALRAALSSLSPMAVLERGYSIARLQPGGDILTDAESLTLGDSLELILARGRVLCRVTENNGKTEDI
jgi:exodeoxyribonuclease VII large subunit